MFVPTLCLQQERKKDKEKIKKRKENDLPGAVMQINKWVPVTIIIKSHCRLAWLNVLKFHIHVTQVVSKIIYLNPLL